MKKMFDINKRNNIMYWLIICINQENLKKLSNEINPSL